MARLTYDSAPLTRWTRGAGQSGDVGEVLPEGVPLEALVDLVPAPIGLRERAAGGQHFLRLLGAVLAERYGGGYLEHFGLAGLTPAELESCDDRDVRWSDLLAGRSIDGLTLRVAFADPTTPTIPVLPAVDATDLGDVTEAASAFVRWWDRRHATPAGAWSTAGLAAPFAVGASMAGGPVTLTAARHRGGPLDWQAFDFTPDGTLAIGDPASASVSVSVLPAAVTFPGMPAPRWWQFEDGAVDLGGLEAAPDDLGRLVLAEFALVYGNDFFCVPITVASGSVCRVSSLNVDTTFGDTVVIPSAVAHDAAATVERWRMFHVATGMTDSDAGAGLLIVPPCGVGTISGELTEEVLLARDEMANLAWAIERRVVSPVGLTVERREVQAAARRRTVAQRSADSVLRYVFSTEVPDSWLPLVPTLDGPLELQSAHPPEGRLLSGATPFAIALHDLPRMGRHVTRQWHRARGLDGAVHVWAAWQVKAGRGESSSGLRHDNLTHDQGTA